jgi:hypothetical protein
VRNEQPATNPGMPLSEAIEQLRDELLKARAAGANSDIQLPVESMTVELSLSVTVSGDGKAAFTVPIVGLQLGAGASRDRGTEQRVTIVFGSPLDREGQQAKIAQVTTTLPD